MKKSLFIVALVAACAIPVASFAADPCRACKVTAKRADTTLKAKTRKLDSLKRRLEQKVAYSQRKQESYDRKILDCKARADSLLVKLSACNATASFISTIWDSADTASYSCQASNSLIGNLANTVTGVLDCAVSCTVGGALSGWLGGGTTTDNSQCISRCNQKNEALKAKCRNKATTVCSQIVRYKTKSEGYKTIKASHNPTCTGSAPTACPNGTLRNIYIQIHGPQGDDKAGAQAEVNTATTAAGKANTAYECCTSGGTYVAETNTCTPKPAAPAA